MAEEPEEPKLHPKRLAHHDAKCPRASKKEYRPLVKAAWNAGWWCEKRGSNYIHCYPPDDGEVVIVKSTPSGSRTLENTKARFRRSGLDV